MKLRNTSEHAQVFAGHPPFAPGEVREVSDEDGEVLARSPHLTVEEEKPKKKSFKAIEPEEKQMTE